MKIYAAVVTVALAISLTLNFYLHDQSKRVEGEGNRLLKEQLDKANLEIGKANATISVMAQKLNAQVVPR